MRGHGSPASGLFLFWACGIVTVATLHVRTASMASFKCLGGVDATGPQQDCCRAPTQGTHPRGQLLPLPVPPDGPVALGVGSWICLREQRCPPAVPRPTWSCCCRQPSHCHGSRSSVGGSSCRRPHSVSDLSSQLSGQRQSLMETKCRGAEGPRTERLPCWGRQGSQASQAPSVLH